MNNLTSLHPIGFTAAVLLGLAMLLVPRRYVLAPMLIMACVVSPAQRIVLAGLDFDLLRLMILFGWTRVMITGENRGFRWKTMDTLLVSWTLSVTVLATLREATSAMFIYRLGLSFDAIGMYFLFRFLIRGWSDVEAIIRSAAVISVPVAVAFLIEHATGRNMFAVFGGVPEITTVRDGKLRCRGPFPHPIIAGCFWAALMPMISALWWRARTTRWLAPVGLAAAATVVMTTSSATPISAMYVGAVATVLYPLRRYTAWFRWGAVGGLVMLHLVMINPVWHLLARINLVGGTGWYRYKIIDEFVNRFDEWWLLGTGAYHDWWQYGFGAITNQFVQEGVDGGLLTLTLFVAILVTAFGGVGRIARSAGRHRFRRFFAWAVGASLLVHCASFLGVSYFGQISVVWYLGLGLIGSMVPAGSARCAYRVVGARDQDSGFGIQGLVGMKQAIGAES